MEKGFWNAAGLFGLGGVGYAALEIFWRGYTHWTMMLTGGLVFLGLELLDCRLSRYGVVPSCLAGAAWVTLTELLVGLCVNRALSMQVWDYSDEWGNLFGQICPRYMVFWFLLCGLAMPLARYSAKSLAFLNRSEYNARVYQSISEPASEMLFQK